MLTIRTQQIERFSEGLDPEFERDAVAFLRKEFPELGDTTDSELRLCIRDGAALAADFGIDEEENVLLFTAFMFLFGWEFPFDPEYPWAWEILRSPDLDESEKMELLYEAGDAVEQDLRNRAGEEPKQAAGGD